MILINTAEFPPRWSSSSSPRWWRGGRFNLFITEAMKRLEHPPPPRWKWWSRPSMFCLLFRCFSVVFLLMLTFLFLTPRSSSLLVSTPPPPVFTGEQLALLQYRLSMSSMPYQPHAPPGSATLHTYQVLLPFHLAPRLLKVNLQSVASVHDASLTQQSLQVSCFWRESCKN